MLPRAAAKNVPLLSIVAPGSNSEPTHRTRPARITCGSCEQQCSPSRGLRIGAGHWTNAGPAPGLTVTLQTGWKDSQPRPHRLREILCGEPIQRAAVVNALGSTDTQPSISRGMEFMYASSLGPGLSFPGYVEKAAQIVYQSWHISCAPDVQAGTASLRGFSGRVQTKRARMGRAR